MRAVARFLTSPVMCVLWAALLFLDWGSLPNDSAASSTAARHRPFPRLIHFPIYRGFDDCPLPPQSPRDVGPARTYADYAADDHLFFVCRMPTGPVAISARGSTALPPRAPLLGFVVVTGDTSPRYKGFWAPTSAVVRLHTGNTTNSFSAADRAQLPRAIFAAVESFRDDEQIHPIDYWLIRAADSSRTTTTPHGDRTGILAVSSTPLLAGYAHNTAALAVAILLIAGLARHTDSLLARYGRRGRRARGHCPACDYDLTFAFDNGCPECGWNRRADPPSHHASGPLKST